MNEDKAARYHRLRRRSAILAVLWSGALLAALVVTGGGLALRSFSADLVRLTGVPAGWAPTATVALFVSLLGLLHATLGVPLAYHGGLVLERRFGLSRQPAASWWRDQAKSAVMTGGFAVLAACGVYAALSAWPGWWWAAAWIGFVVLSAGLTHLAPVVLLPLFFTFRPLGRAGLHRRLMALAERVGTRVLGVYEWQLSDRTRKVNAALAGLGRTRRILLSDTLLADYSDDEIEVILAHELAHHVHRDIWKGLAYEAAVALGGFYAAHLFLSAAAAPLGLDGPADVAGLPALLLVTGVLSLLVAPVANALSRRHERRADSFALEATGNAGAFVSAMRRMAAQNLAEESPSWLARGFFYTHPPVAERIRMARAWAAARGGSLAGA